MLAVVSMVCEVAVPKERGPRSDGPAPEAVKRRGPRALLCREPGPDRLLAGRGGAATPLEGAAPPRRGETGVGGPVGAWSWARMMTGLAILGPVRGPQRREREQIGGSTCHLDLELSSLSAEKDQGCSPVERTAREGHTRSGGERAMRRPKDYLQLEGVLEGLRPRRSGLW
ncbi:hypothetical protein NDU88_005586 [Pleurodeles waltl]|uniref:Uncharacterized protein n=1 Tax=Pleurodeles waltl TaxID=8319 RepID=A0AAV7MYW0_PLEWA|nr:hypothetical protein NDU88_005586 [Pleurodeles waltl]